MLLDLNREGWQFLSWTPLRTRDSDARDAGLSHNRRDWTAVTIGRILNRDGNPLLQEETVRVPHKDLQYWGRNWTTPEGRATMVNWIATYLPRTDDGWSMRRMCGASMTYPMDLPASALRLHQRSR